MNESKQPHTGNILLAYKSLLKAHTEPPGYIKVTVYLTAEDLLCYCDYAPIEKGMPVAVLQLYLVDSVEEIINEDVKVPTYTWHLSCFDSWIDLLSCTYEMDHTKFQDFLSRNPDLIVPEKLRGIGQ